MFDNKYVPDIDVSPEGVDIFQPEEWLENSSEKQHQIIALWCLKHWIENKKLGNNLSILEVGPLPITDFLYKGKRAPISFFKSNLPNNKYLGIGGHFIDDEMTSNYMGGVDFISGFIDTREPEFGINSVKDYFGRNPDIIYGKHVFENSPSMSSTFPLGTSYMLDGTASLLKENGYLIIDNYGGKYYNVLKGDFEYSKHLKLVAVYYYGRDKGIFIYQKPEGTDESAKLEINEVNYKRQYYSLENQKQKLEKSLLEYEKRKNSIIKDISKTNDKIKNYQQQLEKIKATTKQIDNIQIIINQLEKNIYDLHKKKIELIEKLKNLPSIYEEKKSKLAEIDSQIEIVKEKLTKILNKKT